MRPVLALALAPLCLAGCQTMNRSDASPPDPAAAQAAQRARADALGLATGDCAAATLVLIGRVAVSNGKQGGSGQIEWTQGAGRLHLLLSAPITRQNWILDVEAAGATLQGVPNGPLHGRDAAGLLRDATGWDVPVEALGCWMRAVAADPEHFGVAAIRYGIDLLPLRIEQGGWAIDYREWKPDPITGLSMPTRINAQRGDSRIRLIVDRWGLE